ncbi:PilZ domain-containing protein [Methylovulum miyakonense]|uniref:PilZ domain-containing protein n=1 Tax=Methylovulum miyakonense TaxID=645578 RepID=UPI000372A7B2|nr:PilZ domain-containing protein [Methylovulum miyakonense]
MSTPNNRAYRKNINSKGWLYLGGEVQEMATKNISITGVLVKIENKNINFDKKRTLQKLLASKSIDFYFPKLRLSGEAKVVRVESEQDGQIMLAMEFSNVAYEVDHPLFNRKSFRKSLTIPGRLLIDDEYHDFISVNMSQGGFMIHLPKKLAIKNNRIAQFEFNTLKLKGFAKIVWANNPDNTKTVMGLQYVKPKADSEAEADNKPH